MKTHSLKWFKNRIGKCIYRNYYKCCAHCDDVAKYGLIIFDETHARILYDIQNDYAAEGIELNYRDKL